MITPPTIRWHTQDGSSFDSEEKALKHQKLLEAEEKVADTIDASTNLQRYDCEAIARELVIRRHYLISILQGADE